MYARLDRAGTRSCFSFALCMVNHLQGSAFLRRELFAQEVEGALHVTVLTADRLTDHGVSTCTCAQFWPGLNAGYDWTPQSSSTGNP